MKKILSILIAAVLVASLGAVAVSAQSYNPNGGCDIEFTVKKADPAAVVKDGIIGEGEYEKLDVDVSPDTSSLTMVFGNNAAMYTNAEEMMATMEYYFSWDEVHGFNFAIKCKPGEFTQTVLPAEGEKPGDEFLCNLGISYEFDPAVTRGDQGDFYYCLSRNKQTGEYYEGHYNQLGKTGTYDPAPKQDYEIVFNADGTIVYEVSVGFNNFLDGTVGNGTKVGLTVTCLAGTDTVDELYTNCYGVSFGEYGFLVDQRNGPHNALATLSDDMIAGSSSGSSDATSNTPGTNPSTDDPGTEPSTDKPVVDPKPDDPSKGNDNPSQGNDNPSQGNDNPTEGNKAPSTADPIVIAAIASAISACGFAISKKRK